MPFNQHRIEIDRGQQEHHEPPPWTHTVRLPGHPRRIQTTDDGTHREYLTGYFLLNHNASPVTGMTCFVD